MCIVVLSISSMIIWLWEKKFGVFNGIKTVPPAIIGSLISTCLFQNNFLALSLEQLPEISLIQECKGILHKNVDITIP